MDIDQFIKEAQARCDAATKGPWRTEQSAPHRGYTVWSGGMRVFLADYAPFDSANCDFAAHTRQDLPAALEIIASLRARAAELEAALERIAAIIGHQLT